MKLDEKLVLLRKKKGLSQLKLAEMLHVSRQAVSRWEVGSAVPSTENLKFLGQLYDVPLEYLLNDDAADPAAATRDTASDKTSTVAKNKKRTAVLLTIVLVLFMLLIGAVHFLDREKGPVRMDEINGEKVITEGVFDMEW